MKMVDIRGERFGKLTAICPSKLRSGTNVVWECECDCGNVTYVAASNLRNGRTQSCGCLTSQTVRRDLTDQRFGHLVAIEATENRYNRSIIWECKCDCGNTVFVPSGYLTNGSKKSCGCQRKNSKKNIPG